MAEPEGLVLGFSQKHDILNTESLARSPLPIYHRRAGGTAVHVGPHLLDLDVVLPAGHPLILADIVESYRWFGEAWVAALRMLLQYPQTDRRERENLMPPLTPSGVENSTQTPTMSSGFAPSIKVRTVPPEEAHTQRNLLKQPETRPYESLMQRACYGTLSSYEVVVGRRKVVGLDMIRRRAGSLLQAGVVLHWETETLAHMLGHTPHEQELLRTGLLERAIGLDIIAGRTVTPHEVITTFEQVLQGRHRRNQL